MQEGPIARRRRARWGHWIERVATAVIVTVSVAIVVAMLAGVAILVLAPWLVMGR